MERLSREDVIKVLSCPYKELLTLAIAIVNLNEKESKTIDYIYIKGYTEEETAEKMEYSRSSIQNYKRKAIDKMAKAWKTNTLIDEILLDY